MKQDKVFLKHMLDEIEFVLKESKNLDFEKFMKNEILKRAFVRSFEIIGEATKNISKDFKEKNPQVEWKKIAGLRDRLIHKYFGINWDIVWDLAKNKLPELKGKIYKIMKEKAKC